MFQNLRYAAQFKSRSEAGISLVEVLVAVFIVGLMSSLVVLTIPRDAPAERKFAGALGDIIRDSIDRSVLRGVPVAIDIRNNVIRVHDWKGSGWNVDSSFKFEIDDKIVAQQIEPYDPYRAEEKPELICDPTGLVSPAVFRITGASERWEVIVTESGDVQLDER